VWKTSLRKKEGETGVPGMLLVLCETQQWAECLLWPLLTSLVLAVEIQ